MKILRAIKAWFKWIRTRRVILKTIKSNFKLILNECEEESNRFTTGNITVKFYCKILKQSRAKRNITTSNKAADLYDNALKLISETVTKECKSFKQKCINYKDIKTSLKTTYKQLRKNL